MDIHKSKNRVKSSRVYPRSDHAHSAALFHNCHILVIEALNDHTGFLLRANMDEMTFTTCFIIDVF